MKKAALLSILFVVVKLAAGMTAEAQQPKKIPRIGYLSLRSGPSGQDEAFKQGLRELGWVEGQNIAIEYRWAADQTDRLPSLAEDLVRLKVDVIVAWTGPVVQAAKNATSTIPIVMWAADPVETGLVASLARPGGNVTGLSLILPDLAGKRLELLREVLPRLARVAFLAHAEDPSSRLFIKESQDAGQSLGLKIQPLVVKGPEEFEGAFAAMIRERAGALVVHPLFISGGGHGPRIAALAARNRLPTMSDGFQFAEAGGLMYYGPDRIALSRRDAVYVDKILKGAKPAELPVEQPMKFELVINLKTAKQIGLTIPQSVLYRADKVIK
jgi:putative tryptophan/tyrosine transport system substrate-binding protein